MKPKSALFISAVLTAFILAILGGVVSTLTPNKAQAAVTPTEAATLTEFPTQAEPTATIASPTPVGPEQAASIAAEYMKKNDVYSVERITQNNVDVFKVVFSSNDVVYVGLDGAVLATEMLPTTTVLVEQPTVAPQKHKNNNGGGASGNNGGEKENEHEQEHENEPEHEED